MKTIPLSRGLFTVVDDGDYEQLSVYKWCALNNGRTFYAARNTPYKDRRNGEPDFILMHRVIAQTPAGMITDHISGDSLDNRKANLRTCDKSQNGCNRGAEKTSTSRFKGVSWCSEKKRWTAQIQYQGQHYMLGRHKTEEAAARAYDKAAKQLHGEYAKINNA